MYIAQSVTAYDGGTTLTLNTFTPTTGNYLLVIASSVYNGANFTISGNGNTFTNIATYPNTVGQLCGQGFLVEAANAGATVVSITNTSSVVAAGAYEIAGKLGGSGYYGSAYVGSPSLNLLPLSQLPVFGVLFVAGQETVITPGF
jgi:hypothetical protein